MNTIKHIVFDVGRVLIHWDPEIPFRHLIPDPEKRRWFLTNVCNAAWNIEQDRGRTWRQAEDQLIRQYPEEATLIRAFRQNWIQMLPGALDDGVTIMKALMAAGHDVTLLTNFNQETFPIARENFPFLKLPRGVTVSGEVRLIKPDLAIFNHHAAEFSLEPAAILFFDDSAKNIEGARAAGWQAKLFTDATTMADDLHQFGVRY